MIENSDVEVARLLDSAAKVVKRVRHCWLLNEAPDGVMMRPMGVVSVSHDDDWLIRFITDRRSDKASDIRLVRRVDITFQHEQDEGYVALTGVASLIEDTFVIGRLWRDGYNTYFPTAKERENAIFIDVSVERIKLWIRGVTPEPFGLQPAILELGRDGDWYQP